jgi:hypothetical protein
VVVGEHVAIARHDHAGPQALLPPVAIAERVVAEEELKERIVREWRGLPAHDLGR